MMATKAKISIHQKLFFILNNNINIDANAHINNGNQLPNANPIPIRANNIPIIAPAKWIQTVNFSDDLDHVAIPTADNATPERKNKALCS